MKPCSLCGDTLKADKRFRSGIGHASGPVESHYAVTDVFMYCGTCGGQIYGVYVGPTKDRISGYVHTAPGADHRAQLAKGRK